MSTATTRATEQQNRKINAHWNAKHANPKPESESELELESELEPPRERERGPQRVTEPGTQSFHVLRHVFDAKNSDVLRNLGLPAKPGESSGSFHRFVFSMHALAVASASAPGLSYGPSSRFDTSCRCCSYRVQLCERRFWKACPNGRQTGTQLALADCRQSRQQIR